MTATTNRYTCACIEAGRPMFCRSCLRRVEALKLSTRAQRAAAPSEAAPSADADCDKAA
ncbi:MAG: hypothetical protein KDK91_02625 [Gammaproteobacteria bacterium]|nr:hypothetical protein [Gammaproteobacteria bacterium]